ncbi:MAG: superoxide dismutase, Ni [Candidatus Kariarchaeaceae archaeon]|jgi:nickel superoxide dismutase
MINKIIKMLTPVHKAYAHCDVPCGIYDPHLAQVSAHTVLRMVNLMQALDKNDPDYDLKMSRYISVKEEHGELAKHEIRIIWGDYLKQEHEDQFSELKGLTWKLMKQGSAGRQTASEAAAKEFLEGVLKFSEIFWKTKGKSPRRVAAPYPSGGEIVLPE